MAALERASAAVVRSLTGRAAETMIAERSGFNLPPASILLLEHLEAAGPRRVSQIAQCQQVVTPAITPRIKDLEAAGLIRRENDPSDGRAALISISARGRTAVRRVRAARCAILAEALGGGDPERIAAAVQSLSWLAEALEGSRLAVPLA
jgi:DNA-binding MarR family transcriptional regulator